MLRQSPAVFSRRLDALKAAGVIEEGADGALRPVDWEKRQTIREPAGEGALSGAERTRRWRDRRAADVTPRDVTVTGEKEQDEDSEKDSAPAARASDRFDEFWQAFPRREGNNPEAPARAAFRRAIASAKAYAAECRDREPKFIAAAARWLSEARYDGTAPPKSASPAAEALGVWIAQGLRAWSAWSDCWRATKGKSPPVDSRGGWRFPSNLPLDPLERAA